MASQIPSITPNQASDEVDAYLPLLRQVTDTLLNVGTSPAAVSDPHFQLGETGVNPQQSRPKVDQLGHDGNELNFDFPPKTPNKDFHLGALNRNVRGLQEFLTLQLRREMGHPSIRWSADQWTSLAHIGNTSVATFS